MNIDGTDGDDTLVGTAGDDLITTGDNPGSDQVMGSAGNDEIDFTGITGNPGGFVVVDYSGIGATIGATIDGGANTGSVIKDGLGTDTFVNVEAPLLAGWTTGGLSLIGTSGADTFNVSLQGQQWMSVRPGDGVDTIIVGGDPSLVRLDMSDGFGIEVNLATGLIADDGFGNAETIQGTAPLWEVFGSGGDDSFTGSLNGESYRYNGGDNTLDGGLGFDRLRYDSFGVTSVTIDAANGVVNGTFDFGGTFTDTISGFERLRGSNGDDQITGEAGVDNRYEGRGGIDTFVHLGGADTISDFDPTTETLIVRVAGLGQAGFDAAVAGAAAQGGDTLVTFGSSTVLFSGIAPGDLSGANLQFVDLDAPSLVEGTDGDDVLNGTPGDDVVLTGDATPNGDVVNGSAGDDTIDMTGNDGVNGFVTIDYSGVTGPATITVDGARNIASVDKGVNGIDTLVGVAQPLSAGWVNGGLGISGTAQNDTFNLAPGSQQWMSVRGGAGIDSFDINGAGLVRMDFRDATQGIDVNLFTGVIADDGFGNAETITGATPVHEVRGSAFDDTVTFSDAGDSYRYESGSNAITGGGGFDRLRYDVGQVQRIEADLGAGQVRVATASGVFTDTVSGIEQVRGSAGGDLIIAGDNRTILDGRDGDDTLVGSLGNDVFTGGAGANTFVLRGGFDSISDFNVGTDSLFIDIPGLSQADVDAAFTNVTLFDGRPLVGFTPDNNVTFDNLTLAQVRAISAQLGDAGVSQIGNVIGTDENDTLEGTLGEDLIITGDNPGSDNVVGSGGNDEIDFSGIKGDPGGFVSVDYSGIGATIDVTIDGGANTGSVVKNGLGTDTFTNVELPLFAGWTTGGLSIVGSSGNDTFDVAPEGPQWMSIRPGDGVDTILVNGNGTARLDPSDPIGAVRLDMSDGNGIDVNLATGVIADDGFGNVEQITGNSPLWEVFGSQGNDVFSGSDNAESYRYRGGDNDLDGGLGFDRLRYDTFGVASVAIDTTAGIATGTLSDGGAFIDTISGFERLRGSDGNDLISGEAGVDNRYEGRGGSDAFVHLGGDDTISDFDPTTETLIVRVAGLDQAQVDAAIAGATNVAEGARADFGAGSVLFTGLSATELSTAVVLFIDPVLPVLPAPPPTPAAWTVGDPHLLTLDGVGYDFHAVGEFVLLRGTSTGGFSDFEIQSRMGPVLDDLGNPLPNVSANIAIAARLGNGSEIMIDSADASPLSIDGATQVVSDGGAINAGGDLILRDGNMYTVVFAGADGTVGDGDARLNVIVRDGFVDLSVQISADMAGGVEGLLGDGNGNPDDDIALADGTVLERPLAFDDLYGDDLGTNPNLRDDWRVTTDEQSLFIYDAGESLAGLYDPDAPGGAPTEGFTDDEVNAAQQAVEGAGLTPGTLAFENAVQDFLVAGDDRFIDSSSNDVAPTTEFAGSAGALGQDEARITIDVSLADRGDGALDDAVVNFSVGGNAPILGKAANGAGNYDIALGSNSPGGTVDAVRDYDETTDADIGVGDALNALRLAVGLDPSFGTASGMDFIAADVDQDERVSVSDALDILRFAVGLETENAPRWVFLDKDQDLSAVTADNVAFDKGLATGPLDQVAGPIEMTGVLLGNVAEV